MMDEQQVIAHINSVLTAYGASTEWDKHNRFYRKVWISQNDITALKIMLEHYKQTSKEEKPIDTNKGIDELEAARTKFFADIQKAKDELFEAYNDILRSVGMYDVDVIRKHDRKKGRILVVENSKAPIPSFQFHPYNVHNKISRNVSGNVPSTGNITGYLTDVFEVAE